MENPKVQQNKIQDVVAKAIQRADKSFFFENYNKQSKVVIYDLQQAGYLIVPQKLSDNLLDSATDSLADGRHRPRDIIRNIYKKLTEPFIPS